MLSTSILYDQRELFQRFRTHWFRNNKPKLGEIFAVLMIFNIVVSWNLMESRYSVYAACVISVVSSWRVTNRHHIFRCSGAKWPVESVPRGASSVRRFLQG